MADDYFSLTEYCQNHDCSQPFSCHEDFATAGTMYVTNPQQLLQESPERYRYFQQLFTDPTTGQTYEYLSSP